jgi:predicted Kef-type K+ transport protein
MYIFDLETTLVAPLCRVLVLPSIYLHLKPPCGPNLCDMSIMMYFTLIGIYLNLKPPWTTPLCVVLVLWVLIIIKSFLGWSIVHATCPL